MIKFFSVCFVVVVVVKQCAWYGLDHSRTLIFLWSSIGSESPNGIDICRRMVSAAIVFGCYWCRHIFRDQVFHSSSDQKEPCNSTKTRWNSPGFDLFLSLTSFSSTTAAWCSRTFSSKRRKRRRRTVQLSNSLAPQLIDIFGKRIVPNARALHSTLDFPTKSIFLFCIFSLLQHQWCSFSHCNIAERIKKQQPNTQITHSLTPPYLVVVALTAFTSFYLRDKSQYWLVEHNDLNCPNYWWRNVFYIQNMYPLNEMCMSWSWFLSADFQCFCLTSLLLVVYTK